MDESSMMGGAVAGGGITWLAQMLWAKVFSSEGKANTALVAQLSERIANLESRQAKQERDLDEERSLRRVAEDRVHALEIDNLSLRFELKRQGIDLSLPLSSSIQEFKP